MKTVYVLNEYVSSGKNGIGTFLKNAFCYKQKDMKICFIDFNSNQSEFSIIKTKESKRMLFPLFSRGNFVSFPEVAIRIFRIYIGDSEENIFLVNHSPCLKFLQLMKQYYPLSKFVYVIHDLSWTSLFLGDCKRWAAFLSRKYEMKEAEYLRAIFEEEQEMCKIAHRVVCLSYDTLLLLQNVYHTDKNKIRLIPNGLVRGKRLLQNKTELKRLVNIDEHEKLILYVGRATKAKGFIALLNAFRLILERQPRVRLIIAGTIQVELSSYKDILSKVIYIGYLQKNELEKWYQLVDIGVLPSYSEQCSYTGIEMMMYSLPIVASDGFGVRNMFHDGSNACIASISSFRSKRRYSIHLAESILTLLSSETLCHNLGHNAQKIAFSLYNVSQMRKKYRQMINEL